jgi:hypothetical protein
MSKGALRWFHNFLKELLNFEYFSLMKFNQNKILDLKKNWLCILATILALNKYGCIGMIL